MEIAVRGIIGNSLIDMYLDGGQLGSHSTPPRLAHVDKMLSFHGCELSNPDLPEYFATYFHTINPYTTVALLQHIEYSVESLLLSSSSDLSNLA